MLLVQRVCVGRQQSCVMLLDHADGCARVLRDILYGHDPRLQTY